MSRRKKDRLRPLNERYRKLKCKEKPIDNDTNDGKRS